MNYRDEIASTNATHWERAVEDGSGHTIPWLDLDLDRLRRFIRGDVDEFEPEIVGRMEPRRMVRMHPRAILADVEGKDVLCLACCGGQQSTAFARLGQP